MDRSGYLLIANEDAGTAERNAVEAAERVLTAGAVVETVWTASTAELDHALARLDGRTVVVAGGDGSIHLLVNRLDRAGLLDSTPVGIVPLGTGNDLARGLSLPLDPADAARRISEGQPHTVPLLRLSTGDVATNNTHLGLGVAAAERAASLKPRLGHLAYTVGGLVAGLRHGSTEVSVTVDGRTLHDGPATVVFVALGPSAGGGHTPSDDVELDDGVVDVFVVTASSVPARLRLLRNIATDSFRSDPSVATDRGCQVAITVGRETTAEVDGEFRQWSGTVSLAIQPNAWTIIT